MSSQQSTVDFILDQISGAGDVSAKKMFGEYGVYCAGKMVASVCDDQLFVKPTAGGRSLLRTVTEASPYPGAKPCFLISAETLEDRDALTELIKVTAQELPLPTRRKTRLAKNSRPSSLYPSFPRSLYPAFFFHSNNLFNASSGESAFTSSFSNSSSTGFFTPNRLNCSTASSRGAPPVA